MTAFKSSFPHKSVGAYCSAELLANLNPPLAPILHGQAAVRRLVAALARRDDGADALRAVDLDQLQIENEQLLARVEQRNAELLSLKLTTGRSVQACLGVLACSSSPASMVGVSGCGPLQAWCASFPLPPDTG